MDTMTYISEKMLDQQQAMMIKGIQPAYVIIGKREASLIMEAEKKFPMVAGSPSQKSQLHGLEVVVDWSCQSRIDVVEGFCLMTFWRRQKGEAKTA